MAGLVSLAAVLVASCGSTSSETESTGSTGTTDTAAPAAGTWGGPTSIVDTGCELVPATTAPGELSGGHIVCPDEGAELLPIPPETSVPSPAGGGVVTGTIVEEGTGAALPSVVGVDELGTAVASGVDGRFGLAVAAGTYHLNAIVNRDVSYACTTPTVVVEAGGVEAVEITCRH
jgi:hypothetical protein